MNLLKTKGGRSAVSIALILVVFAGTFGIMAMTSSDAAQAANLDYRVDPSTAAGGVFARYLPHTTNTNYIGGYGVYPYQTVRLLCGITYGDPVGPYNNHTWHFVSDLSNPGEGNFWLNDRYVDSPNYANQLAPGESRCANASVNPLYVTPSSGFNRVAAASYGIANAMATPPAGGVEGACTWFVSNALWTGGLAKTSQWTDQGMLGNFFGSSYLKKWGLYTNLPGTIAAWNVSQFLGYMTTTYSLTWQQLVPGIPSYVPSGAQIGDIVAYDWGQGEGLSHLAIVTLIDPNGLEVSDWSTNGSLPSPVIMRPYAYSAVSHMWLNQKYPGVQAYLIHFNR